MTQIKKVNGYKELHSRFKDDSKFLLDYAEVLLNNNSDIPKAIEFLKSSNDMQPTIYSYNLLGNAYWLNGNLELASENYRKLSDFVPNRFLPKYSLFKIYLKQSDSIKAKSVANEITVMPIKVYSNQIVDIKKECAEFLGAQ